ncbi:MAG: ribbon-helix-helix protein, CopG family [Myxococcota bacterium]
MRRSVTVSLPGDLTRLVDRTSRAEGVTRSDVVREALRRYFAHRDFQRLRRAMLPEAEARGVLRDEDVFRDVS